MRFDTRPQQIAMYRERTAQPPVVLKRRKCACGKAVTAKQLAQYGKCDTCRRAVA